MPSHESPNPADRRADALQELSELSKSIELFRRLLPTNPSAFTRPLATALLKSAELRDQLGNAAEAEAEYEEALGYFRELFEPNSIALYAALIARILSRLTTLRNAAGRFEEAEANVKEAITFYQALAKVKPSYNVSRVRELGKLAMLYAVTERFSESEAVWRSVIAICQAHVSEDPEGYESYLAKSTHGLAILYMQLRRFEESVAECRKAIALYLRLVVKKPGVHDKNFQGVKDLLEFSTMMNYRESYIPTVTISSPKFFDF